MSRKESLMGELNNYFKSVTKEQFIKDLEEANCSHLVDNSSSKCPTVKAKNDEQQEESYASLKEDVEAELKAQYNLQLDQVSDALLINKFKERYMKDSQQFDYFEPEEIAYEFYKAYQHRKAMSGNLTVGDVVDKIQERMEMYESQGETSRLSELADLMGWILCDDKY